MAMDPKNRSQQAYADLDFLQLASDIKQWGRELGLQKVGITDTELSEAEHHLIQWLNNGYQGDMHYMQKHGVKRSRPAELEPGTIRIISARMDYLPHPAADPYAVLHDDRLAFVSRYALGRDYHKLLRKRLQQLARRIEDTVGPYDYRVFCDSAPVLDR